MIRREEGMTLVELMVALFVFSFVSVIGVTTINSAIRVQTQVDEKLDVLSQLTMTRNLMRADLKQIAGFAGSGTPKEGVPAAFQSGPATGESRVLFRFMKSKSPFDDLTGRGFGVGIVEYRFEEGKIFRREWEPGRSQEKTAASEQVLLTGVGRVEVKFSSGSVWRDYWAPSVGASASQIPSAISFDVDLEKIGNLHHLFLADG